MTIVAGDEAMQALGAFAEMGLDSESLCREARIATAQLSEPLCRVPAQAFQRIFELAEEQTGDPQIGLHTAERVGSRSIFAYLFRAQRTVGEALQKILGFRQLLFGAQTVELKILDGHAIWVFAGAGRPGATRHVTEYFLTRRCAALYGEAVPPLVPMQVHFGHPAGGRPAEYERVLRCPVHFDVRQHAVVFAAEGLARHLRDANPHVAAEIERVLRRQLEVLCEADEGGRVRLLVRALLLDEAPCDRDAIARRLGVSSRTLQRRLEDQGVTFRELLDDVRRELAQELLADPALGIRNVSVYCGFTEVSGFYRAFRRWTGVGPGDFREALRASPN